ncbi:acetoacetate--CoA ligase [Ornithinimicrobium flavum]|uniref:acetoacetate--CoA ligase n=1 Tax=Ornithinimicrobium flavum TaxID=1288636 RepID=UPI00106F7A44|nr:acetoacetate--CoA ligase [Ornithinimicrobium flavum]
MAADPHSPAPLWEPTAEDVAEARVTAFATFAAERTGRSFATYDQLWTWSTTELEEFWAAVWDFFELGTVFGDHGRVLTQERMPGSTWFPDVRVNYAQYVLSRGRDQDVAVVGVDETGATSGMTWGRLRQEVAVLARWLREHGVGRGDRVVGYLPNVPEAVVALLATASVGAVWSSVGQDYSPAAVVDRLGPLEATVLVAAEGYRYGGRDVDRRAAVREVLGSLPTVTDVVMVRRSGEDGERLDGVSAHDWARVVAGQAEPSFEPVGFDDPLWVLFSSGTTGRPKGIVQSHGGILIEQLKLLGLHLDLGPRDRLFWFTSPSWVMWNIQASALATGASIVCVDGAPHHPDATRLWRLAADHGVTVFGCSPGYLDASRATGIEPGRDLDLSALRAVATTGAPIGPATHAWAVASTGGLPVYSISGGTDICSGFCGGLRTVPVWPGELSVRHLGVAMDAWDPEGRPLRGEVGELVMTRPLPSMPVFFWDDPDGERYRESYFETYPGVWRHGDWITITDRDSVVIHGRSDATLNRHGVRMGSADIYHAVEDVEGVLESLVLGVEEPDGGYWMPLFVVLADAASLDAGLRGRITDAIRHRVSPRHVPDEIIQVPALPHTRTGKRLEVPVKRILQGADPDSVLQRTAVDDPDLLTPFLEVAGRRRAGRA